MYVTKEQCDQYSDRELIARSLEQMAFFTCIYDRYEARLMRYTRRLGVPSTEEAEDILQDAFVNVWKHLNSYDPAMKFSSWLYRIVHNQAISYMRKKISSGKMYQTAFEDSKYGDIPDEETTPQEAILENEKHIHQILSRLSGKYMEVLVLKFLEDMSYEEISDILKIPEGTVATRINRAKKAFRKLAAEQSFLMN